MGGKREQNICLLDKSNVNPVFSESWYCFLLVIAHCKTRVHQSSSSDVKACLQSPCKCLHVWVCAAAHRHVWSCCLWKCMCTPTCFLQFLIYWWALPRSGILWGLVYLQAVCMLSNLLRKTEDGNSPAGSDVSARHKGGETCSQEDLNILSRQLKTFCNPDLCLGNGFWNWEFENMDGMYCLVFCVMGFKLCLITIRKIASGMRHWSKL